MEWGSGWIGGWMDKRTNCSDAIYRVATVRPFTPHAYNFVPHSGQNVLLEGFLAPQLLQQTSSTGCTSGDF